jgi:hypothetical protein
MQDRFERGSGCDCEVDGVQGGDVVALAASACRHR